VSREFTVSLGEMVGGPHLRRGTLLRTKRFPSWRPLVTNRRRCQGRGVCVHRSEAESPDRRSVRLGAAFLQEGQVSK